MDKDTYEDAYKDTYKDTYKGPYLTLSHMLGTFAK